MGLTSSSACSEIVPVLQVKPDYMPSLSHPKTLTTAQLISIPQSFILCLNPSRSLNMHFTPLLAASILASTALAHPGEHEPIASRSEIQRRDVMAKRCQGASAAMKSKRWNKRVAETKAKRGLEARNTTFEIVTESPYYDLLQNDTCVLTPTVTEGPVRFSKRNGG